MRKFLLLCPFVFAATVTWAQDRTVSGKVSSAEDGSTLPGVNVVLKGTTNGTVTDLEGRYTLNLPSSAFRPMKLLLVKKLPSMWRFHLM